MTNWPQQTTDLSALLRSLRGSSPRRHEGVCGHCEGGDGFKALDAKTKELIALGIAVAVRCDDCIAFHVKACVEQGATKEKSARRWEWRFTWARARR